MKKILSLFLLLITSYCVFSEPLTTIPFRDKNKWGYCDSLGNVKIKPIYDSVTLFSSSAVLGKEVALVYLNKKVGLIDKKNRIITPVIWDELEFLYAEIESKYVNALMVKKNKKFGIINYQNQLVIPLEFDSLTIHNIVAKSEYNLRFVDYDFVGKIGNNYYYVSKNGKKTKIPHEEFVEESNTSYGYMPVFEREPDNKNTILADTKLIIERNKNIIDSISSKTYGGSSQYFEVYFKGKVGLVSQEELLKPQIENIIQAQFDSILESYTNYMQEPIAFLVKKGEYITVINSKGEVLLPLKFDEVSIWNPYFVVTKSNGKFGFYDILQKYEIPPKYDFLKYYGYDNPLFFIKLNGKSGFINKHELQYFKN